MPNTIIKDIKINGTLEEKQVEPPITLKELFTSIIELRTEITMMKKMNRSTVRQFTYFSVTVVILQLVTLYAISRI
jgi:hypothetical protein